MMNFFETVSSRCHDLVFGPQEPEYMQIEIPPFKWFLYVFGFLLVPFTWLRIHYVGLGSWLTLIMVSGPLLTGLFLFTNYQNRAFRIRKEKSKTTTALAIAYRQTSLDWLRNSLLVAVGVGVGTEAIMRSTGSSQSGYDFLYSHEFPFTPVMGLLPVLAIVYTIIRLLNRRPMGLTYILAATSLLAPWFWVGYVAHFKR